jgi:hypothetical protein
MTDFPDNTYNENSNGDLASDGSILSKVFGLNTQFSGTTNASDADQLILDVRENGTAESHPRAATPFNNIQVTLSAPNVTFFSFDIHDSNGNLVFHQAGGDLSTVSNFTVNTSVPVPNTQYLQFTLLGFGASFATASYNLSINGTVVAPPTKVNVVWPGATNPPQDGYLPATQPRTEEGNSGNTKSIAWDVSLATAAPAGGVVIEWNTVDGSGRANVDYVPASGQIRFAAGSTVSSDPVPKIQIMGDTVAEPNRDVHIEYRAVTSNVIFTSSNTNTLRTTGTIIDEDVAADVQAGAEDVVEALETAPSTPPPAVPAPTQDPLECRVLKITGQDCKDLIEILENKAPPPGGGASNAPSLFMEDLAASPADVAASVEASQDFFTWLLSGYTGRLIVRNSAGIQSTYLVTGALSEGAGGVISKIVFASTSGSTVAGLFEITREGTVPLSGASSLLYSCDRGSGTGPAMGVQFRNEYADATGDLCGHHHQAERNGVPSRSGCRQSGGLHLQRRPYRRQTQRSDYRRQRQ